MGEGMRASVHSTLVCLFAWQRHCPPNVETHGVLFFWRAAGTLPYECGDALPVSFSFPWQVHCPLNAETRGLLDGPMLACMKPSAYLINTARGAIVDQERGGETGEPHKTRQGGGGGAILVGGSTDEGGGWVHAGWRLCSMDNRPACWRDSVIPPLPSPLHCAQSHIQV